MPKGTHQKLKLYRLGRIMLKSTDEEHGLTINEIKDKLAEFEITADRKSLYDDLRELEVLGLGIDSYTIGRNTYYYVAEKPFEIAETKLLVDSIQASKFITERKSRKLIKKLMENVSVYEEAQLNRQVVVSGRIKTMNESIYYNVDEIHNSISNNRSICFDYLKWDLEKRLVSRKDEPYEVSPWALTISDENYYLVGYDIKTDKIKHYRVDKMRGIRMTDNARSGKEAFKQFNVASYAKENFSMYGGKEVAVLLAFKDELVGVMIDRFGSEIPIHRSKDPGWSETRVDVAVSNQFFGWIFALGSDVRIIGPQDVRDDFVKQISDTKSLYHGND